MKPNEFKVFAVFIMILIVILVIVVSFTGCNSGWSVAGHDITPKDTSNTVFIEILDQDSVMHWYAKIYNGENWCYNHSQYEMVKVEK